MSTLTRGRTRPRLVKLAAGAALAGTALGLVETGAVHAAVSPPLNLTVVEVPGPALNIDWDTPVTGDPVTYYRIRIDRTDTPAPVDFETFVPASQTYYNGYAAVPNRTYNISVSSNDEPTLGTATTSITTSPAPPVECETSLYSPFCTVDAFVRQQYNDWLDRAPTLDELLLWRGQLAGGNWTQPNRDRFLEELRAQYDVKAGPVIRLYIAYFLRNPEYAGYKYWLNAITQGGWTMGQVSDFFAASPEFQRTYGALDNGEFVALVYHNVMGRAPDAAGYAYWVRQLESGHSRGWMMMQFTEAPSLEFQDRTVIAVVTTEVYAEMLNRVPTLAEYDAATYAMSSLDYPVSMNDGGDRNALNWLYNRIINSNEYRARITIR